MTLYLYESEESTDSAVLDLPAWLNPPDEIAAGKLVAGHPAKHEVVTLEYVGIYDGPRDGRQSERLSLTT